MKFFYILRNQGKHLRNKRSKRLKTVPLILKKNEAFSASLASHALQPWEQKTTEGGQFWAQWGKLQKKLRGKQGRLIHLKPEFVSTVKSSKAPYKSLDSIFALCHCTKAEGRSLGRGGSSEGLGAASLSIHVEIVLEEERINPPPGCSLLSPVGDNHWSNPGSLLPSGGQAGWGQRPGSVWEAGRLRSWLDQAVSLPSPHTWRDIQSQARDLRTARGSYCSAHPGEGMRDFLE